jgi:hypothetical protein
VGGQESNDQEKSNAITKVSEAEIEKPAAPEVPEGLRALLTLLQREIEYREKQLELSRYQLDRTSEYSRQVIEKEYEDRDKERSHELKVVKAYQRFVFLLILALFLFIAVSYAISREVASEIIRFLWYLVVAGAFYYLGRYSERQKPEDR